MKIIYNYKNPGKEKEFVNSYYVISKINIFVCLAWRIFIWSDRYGFYVSYKNK